MTASRPWMKFYTRDWRGDQALRAVSLAARGLWMECLCIMHEAEPRGHLLLNGRKVETETLARMTGTSSDEVSSLMDELRTAGVFSVTRNGIVFSRRMIRDEKAAKEGQKAVTKRWSQAAEVKEEIPHPNRSVASPPWPLPSTQRPEGRDQKESIPESRQPGGEFQGEREDGDPTAPSELPAPADLETRLREAARYEQNPAPSLCVIGPIEILIGEGFDLDREILPIVRDRASRLPRPAQSWAYFVPAIREQRDRTAGHRPDGPSVDDAIAAAKRRLGNGRR